MECRSVLSCVADNKGVIVVEIMIVLCFVVWHECC